MRQGGGVMDDESAAVKVQEAVAKPDQLIQSQFVGVHGPLLSPMDERSPHCNRSSGHSNGAHSPPLVPLPPCRIERLTSQYDTAPQDGDAP